MQIKKVILVFKTHFDIGFTKLSREILEDYAGEMLDRVVETCQATRDMGELAYVWTMPAWPLEQVRDRVEGARAEVLDGLIARRQVVWHALPYTSHYDFAGVGDAVWGLRYAADLSRHYGCPPRRAAKMTDVPGHGRFLPELLASAGIRFLHLGCNEFAKPPEVPQIFWWEAPSGKRVLTMYNSGYGTPLYAPDDWPFSTWVALMNTQDNSGPQTAEIVEAERERLLRRYPGAEIACGTLDDVFDALSNEDLSALPVVRWDLADTWIHGVASYPRESALIRRLRGRLSRIECARANEPADASIEQALATAWDNVALFAEHTWGLDVKTWLGAIPDYEAFDEYRRTSPRCARMEESWREQTARAEAAADACAQAEQALGLEPPRAFAFHGGTALHGEQTLAAGRYRLDFSADTGVIHGLYDVACGCPLLVERDGTGVFSYRYDRYGADDLTEYLRAYARRFPAWGVEDNGRIDYPECAHAVRTPAFRACQLSGRTLKLDYAAGEGDRFGDAAEISIYVTLPEGDAPVRVRVELRGKRATPYVESAGLCMPLPPVRRYLVNKPGNVLDPREDIAPGANHAFYALEHFIAAETEAAAVAVVSHDCPLVSIGENGVYAYRREYEEHAPELRFCLFNNMWGTNFPQWIEGDMAFEFDVFSTSRGETDAIYARAASLAENPDGLNKAESPFAMSAGLRVAQLRPAEGGWLLCVQNLSAQPNPARISREGWRFAEANLLGQPLGERTCDGAVEATFAPYELRAFLAQPF